MRTTVNLDDDLLDQVRLYADGQAVGLGKALSDLVKRGLASDPPLRFKKVNGLPVVILPPDSPPVSTELIKKLETEEE